MPSQIVPVLIPLDLDQSGELFAGVCLICPDDTALKQAAARVLAVQNGTATMRTAPHTFAGDTAVQVEVRPHPEDADAVLVEVSARRPGQLTYAFVFAGTQSRETAERWYGLWESRRHYILTAATGPRPDFDQLDLIKYNLTWRL